MIDIVQMYEKTKQYEKEKKLKEYKENLTYLYIYIKETFEKDHPTTHFAIFRTPVEKIAKKLGFKFLYFNSLTPIYKINIHSLKKLQKQMKKYNLLPKAEM